MRYVLDTEYDGHNGPLISMALISDDRSKEIYLVCRKYANDPWVYENVIPHLDSHQCQVHRETLAEYVGVFLRDFLLFDDDIVIIADSMSDIGYFSRAYSTDGDGKYIPNPKRRMSFVVENVESYPNNIEGLTQHNAWCDALALLNKIEDSKSNDASKLTEA